MCLAEILEKVEIKDINVRFYTTIYINNGKTCESVEFDSKTYFNWYYPQIRECLYILVKFNIKSYVEIDNIFDRINEEIKSKIKKGGDQNV